MDGPGLLNGFGLFGRTVDVINQKINVLTLHPLMMAYPYKGTGNFTVEKIYFPGNLVKLSKSKIKGP